jgi:AraC family transcriptional regulator, transcriptional activator of pobA
VLLFLPEFVELGARTVDPLRGASLLSPAWPVPALQLTSRDRAELLELADQLAAEQARPLDDLQPYVMAALLRAILLRGERIAREAGTGPVLPASLARFFTILERDCLATRSVAHYAKEAGLSPRRLAELLVASTGKSTKEVIDDRVVLEHKRLLANTDLTIKELADRTGFAEPTNFVKFFRHRAGTTPQAFRRNLPSRRSS